MADIIKSRRDTAENWRTANPTLAEGELGFETDTKRYKLGDGKSAWNDLDYNDYDILTLIRTNKLLLLQQGSYSLSDNPVIGKPVITTNVKNRLRSIPISADTAYFECKPGYIMRTIVYLDDSLNYVSHQVPRIRVFSLNGLPEGASYFSFILHNTEETEISPQEQPFQQILINSKIEQSVIEDSDNPVASKAIYQALDEKQDKVSFNIIQGTYSLENNNDKKLVDSNSPKRCKTTPILTNNLKIITSGCVVRTIVYCDKNNIQKSYEVVNSNIIAITKNKDLYFSLILDNNEDPLTPEECTILYNNIPENSVYLSQLNKDSMVLAETFEIVDAVISADNVFVKNEFTKSLLFKITPGIHYSQTRTEQAESYFSILKDLSGIDQDGATPNFAENFNKRLTSFDKIVIPEDANYILITWVTQNNSPLFKPKNILYNGFDYTQSIFEILKQLTENLALTKQTVSVDTTLYFNVPMKLTKRDYADFSIYSEEQTIDTYVRCLLRLPKNYGQKKCPLVFFAHGSGAVQRSVSTDWTARYIPFVDYLCKEGYAVFDCCALPKFFTDKIPYSDNWGTPTTSAAILACYNYIIQNYEIDTNNVFGIAKSQGGVPLLNIAHQMQIPLKCAVCLAVKIDNTALSYTKEQLKGSLEDGGFSQDLISKVDSFEYNQDMSKWPQDFRTQYNEEKFKLTGYLPLYNGTDLLVTTSGADVVANNTYKRETKIPILHINAMDDVNVGYKEQKSFKDSVLRANGICYQIIYPAGYGAHHSVDSTVENWIQDEEKFNNQLATLADGLYRVGFLDTPKWFKVTNHVAEEQDPAVDLAPKVPEHTTHLGILVKNVSKAWVTAVRFFDEFGTYCY